MTHPVCPSCGVAVLPGYARCPRCQAALPYGTGKPRTIEEGGTAVARSFPVAATVGVLAAALLVIVVIWQVGGEDPPPAPAVTSAAPTAEAPVQVAPRPPAVAADPAPTVAGPSPAQAAATLERTLARQRMWSTVEVHGSEIDVRSASCRDPTMAPVIESALATLRTSGLTRLRCLAQSGVVVYQRDL